MTARGFLELTADEPAGDPTAKIRAIRLLLVAHLVTETALSVIRSSGLGIPLGPQVTMLVASVGALACAFVPGLARVAAPLGAAIVGIAVVRYVPNVANHTFLLFLALAALALFPGRSTDERTLALSTLRWLAAIVLFATGVQKLMHGTYFHGEFLAFQIASGERFAALFRWVLPGEEFDRLRALGAMHDSGAGVLPVPLPRGSGPFRFESFAGLLVSNSVYLFEMIAPVLLVIRRTRTVAAVATVLFLAAVELGAREIMFGILFVNLVLLFLRGNWTGRLLPIFLAAYAYLIVVNLGLLPQWIFQ